MTHAILTLGCIALCSLTFRIRGGLLEAWQVPGQLARLAFAFAAGLTAWAAGCGWWLALATVPAWWIGSTFPLFDAIDLGSREGTFWGDVGGLTARGALWVLLPALVLWWPHVTVDPILIVWGQGAGRWWVLLIVGPLMPVAYWAGRQSGCRLPGIGQLDWQQTGEAIYGAILGVGIVLAVS